MIGIHFGSNRLIGLNIESQSCHVYRWTINEIDEKQLFNGGSLVASFEMAAVIFV